MMSVSRGASLDEIILEAQKAEEILYRRNIYQRRTEYLNQVSSQDNSSYQNKFYHENYNNQYKSLQGRENKQMNVPIRFDC